VRARDDGGTMGPYSNIGTATTAASVPSAPTGLAATAAGSAQIGLAWGAASEAGGTISQYLVERCQGASCSSFTQVGVSSTLGFTDTGLSGSTAYSYRVRAKDALGVTGPYSNVSAATTAAPVISAPTAPSALASGASQIILKWKAATETGGTISQYRIERCQGVGCTSFAQVGTSAGLSFADAALAALTTYRYRVRAADTIGNAGPYSSVVQATTASSRHWWDIPVRPGQWTPFRPLAPLTPLK
jgi:chitodextrinase